MPPKKVVVFVHGWSVHNTSTYGVLPARLEAEARKDLGLAIDTRQIWLGKYISFKDQVRLDDISRAFDVAIQETLGDVLKEGRKFVCITHSTGGPVVRNWLDKYFVVTNRLAQCPLSHLIMLAPANFGSTLAQLGKERIGRLKAWFDGIEPGQKVLDWLELGSPEAWDLNFRWIDYSSSLILNGPVFPFVITGQTIDRKFFNHVNSYTGELGSDGVVRMAAANLNATYIKLVQSPDLKSFTVETDKSSARTAFCIARGCSHTGVDKGIMESVPDDEKKRHPVVNAILACLKVSTASQYSSLCDQFDKLNEKTRLEELVERQDGLLLSDHYFIHDPNSMVIFRVLDDQGLSIEEFDLKFTAGEEDSPNHLPEGFLVDRQRNSRNTGTLTFYFNYAAMRGSGRIKDSSNKILRNSCSGATSMGLIVEPHITDGFVHFAECSLKASVDQLKGVIKKDQTTMVDIVMKRIVHQGVFQLTQERKPEEFKDIDPGSGI